ncbi:DUF4382 domain-containing protein [Vibrio fortis]|uniref:DUF4382 domain-containing protein n=1 Tax=Vibrio fortis TaxID=212667 RepID=UPI004067B8A9
MNNKVGLVVATTAVLGLAGCGGGSDSSSSTTPVTFSVSDAPVDEVQDVVVTFDKVALLPQNGSEPLVYDVYLMDDEGNPIDENGDPILEGDEPLPLSVNLLDYQGSDSLALISGEVVPVGSYQLCVFARDGDHAEYPSYVTEQDSTVRELTVKGEGACPQGVGKEPNTGVLFFNNAFNVNQQTNDFTIEFDLRRGLKNTSAYPNYTIQRTSISLINNVETGHIEGEVLAVTNDACQNGESGVQAVYLYEGDVAQDDMAPVGGGDEVKPVTTALVQDVENSSDFSFSLGFLDPGMYTLGYTCNAQLDTGDVTLPVPDEFSIYSVQSGVLVTADETSNVSF